MDTFVTRRRISLVCALVLSAIAATSQLGCGGCSGLRTHGVARAAEAAAPPPMLQGIPLRPVESELSPDGLSTFAFLTFAQAINHEDEDALLACAALMGQARMPASVWLEGGVWLLGRKSAQAVPFMEQALAVWPDDISVNLLYAEALMDRGMPEPGVVHMRQYLKRHPDSLEASIELALLLVKSRQFAEADGLLTGITGKQRTPLVDYYHARALIGMNRPDAAVPHLQKAIKAMPDFTEALAELAMLLERKGDLKAARATYERLLKLEFSPKDVRLRLMALSLRLNQPEKALAYLRDAPDNPAFTLAAAGMLIESRHYLQAENLLKKLAAKENAPTEVWLLLADLAWEQRRDLKLALSWLDKIPPQQAREPRATLFRVQLLAQAGHDAEALALIRETKARHAPSPELAEAEARLLARMDKKGDALAVARQAADAWPDNADILFLLGSLQDDTGDKGAAFQTMERLLSIHPENAQALNYVGYTLAEENRDLDRALDLLRKADGLWPDQAFIVDSLAWACFRAGRLEEAWNEIRRAVRLDKQADPTIWEHYGDIAAALNKKEEARRAWRKALDLKPGNAAALRQRLADLP